MVILMLNQLVSLLVLYTPIKFKIMFFVLLIVIGLLIGSFLNVVICRLPRGESVVFPPSRCPRCGGRLSPWDLIPVFSYLWLRGKCKHCGTAISPRYPLVEILTGGLFAAAYAAFGWQPLLLKHLFFLALLVAVTFIDLEHYLIPNRLVIAGLVGGVLINLYTRDLTLLSAALGALVPAAFFLFLALVSRGGMGGGDIKLAAVMGLFLGWPQVLPAVFLAALAGGLVGGVLLVTGRKKRKDPIPFGPFLALGSILMVFFGAQLINWYLQLVGL